jgi:hypothetical protein
VAASGARRALYRVKNRDDEAGVEGLREIGRREPNPEDRVPEAVERAVCELAGSQIQALESAKQEMEAHGEIETEHPGHLGSPDTFYVGSMKGVGRIFQQIFVDTTAACRSGSSPR